MTLSNQIEGMIKSIIFSIKRNKCLTAIELLTPSFIILFFCILRLYFSLENQKYNNDDNQFLFEYSSNLTNKVKSSSQIISNIDDINKNTPIQYKYFLAQCEKHPHVALIGKNFPQKIKDNIIGHFWELPDMYYSDKSNFFKEFDSIDDFNNYINDKNYGRDETKYPKICFGISNDDNKKYSFGIHYDTIDMSKEINFIIDVPMIPDSKTSKNEKIRTQTDLSSFQYYVNSGYLMVLKIIYDYILQEITGTPDAEINFSIIEMKYDSILKNKFHKYLHLLGFFIIISYAIILSINIYREINFRETKKKEYLKCMGINDKVFFLTSFTRCFIINIIHSLSTSIIIKFILTKIPYIYILIILFLYGLVIFSMTYFFQSFQQKSRKGVIMSLLCYCIMCFFYLPIDSYIINKNIIYLFCVLFPPVNLMFGFNVLFTFEKEFQNFSDIKADVHKINVLEMIIFFFLNFIIYLVIGYIISQCFHYEYGITKCCKKRERIPIVRPVARPTIEPVINENVDNFGEEYNDEDLDISSFNQIKPIVKNIKIMTKELMETPGEAPIYDKRIKTLTSRMLLYKNEIHNKIFETSRDSNGSQNKIYVDELEKDFKIQKQRQEIRKMRRALGKTMCSLKDEEYDLKNLDISVLQEVIPNDIMSTNEIDLILETSNTNIENIPKGELNKKKDELNPGKRLEVIKLEKSYKNYKKQTKKVLNELDCTIYENEIFALLGENGAGKSTFISILGGLIEANAGSVIYKDNKEDNGYDILDTKGNNQFRTILGICPQNNNILFNDLTVRENLEIFCLFKYKKENGKKKKREEINDEIKYLLKKFDLDEKTYSLVSELSGGQKRKLCIAIACCGKSKVIILDEPTGGVDIVSRKNIWKILKTLKYEEKIIILISHSMEEVSYLADKIGILKDGKLICSGTSRELIEKYGQYYTLIINQNMDYDDAKELSSYISKNYYYKEEINNNNKFDISTQNSESSNISVDDKHIKLEVFKEKVKIKISAKYFIKEKSAQLFDELKKKNITNYLLIEDKLEDVFINAINKNQNFNYGRSYKSEYMVILSSNENRRKLNWINKFGYEIKMSFLKNIKDKLTILSEILFPIILILIACLVSYIEFLEENKSYEINLINIYDEPQNIYYENLVEIETNDFSIIQRIIEEEKEKEILNDFKFGTVKIFDENIEKFTPAELILYYMKVIDENKKNGNLTKNYADYLLTKFDNIGNKYEFIEFIDTRRKHHPIFYTNYLLNCIIKYTIRKKNEYNHDFMHNDYSKFVNDISITNSPFPLKYGEKNDKKSRNGFSLVFFTSIAFALIPSNIITSIIKEKENKLKHLQILSGLSLLTYWINNYIFELIKYIIISGLSYLILSLFTFDENYLYTLYILYGPAMISFTYFMSYFINNEGHGQTISLLINLLFGTLGSSAVLILRTNEDAKNLGKDLSGLFKVVPSFCMSYGYNELISKNALFTIDNHTDEIDKNPDYILNYIKFDIILLFIDIVVYAGILIILEKKDYLFWRFRKKYRQKYQETDQNEKIEIKYKDNNSKEPVKKPDYENKPLLSVNNIKKTLEIRKKYYKICDKEIKLVLDHCSFNVKNGECFGLIGTNGAGKTTCFRCLCKEIKPDSAIIKINDTNIFDYYSEQNYSIGYCPQFDSVFEYLTVEENIYFFGRIKGIIYDSMGTLANSIIKCLDLEPFRKVQCKNLSGGNKRKLSVGISILSHPDVIFLDEPSTGMDPYTRRLLLNLLNNGYLKTEKNGNNDNNKKKGIILTTHSLEEVEALCDRIGILIAGKMDQKRIGSINDIIQRNKREIILNIEFKKPSQHELTKGFEKICGERVNDIIGLQQFLHYLRKVDYIKYLNKNSLGRDLLVLLNSNKSINKYTIRIWVTYIDYLQKLVNKLFSAKFDKITCIACKLNNFILKIQNNNENNQSDSYIFGILESSKNELFIEEYSYNLTTFEKIFLEFCKEAYNDNNNVEQPFDIESENNDKFCVELNKNY